MNAAATMLSRKQRTRVQRSTVPVRMSMVEASEAYDRGQVFYVNGARHIVVDGVVHPVRLVFGKQS